MPAGFNYSNSVVKQNFSQKDSLYFAIRYLLLKDTFDWIKLNEIEHLEC